MTTLTTIINSIISILNSLIPIIIGLAVIAFLWGLMKYGLSQKEEDRKNARGIIVNGIVILFVMVAFWGLINVFAEFIGVEDYIGGDIQTKKYNRSEIDIPGI